MKSACASGLRVIKRAHCKRNSTICALVFASSGKGIEQCFHRDAPRFRKHRFEGQSQNEFGKHTKGEVSVSRWEGLESTNNLTHRKCVHGPVGHPKGCDHHRACKVRRLIIKTDQLRECLVRNTAIDQPEIRDMLHDRLSPYTFNAELRLGNLPGSEIVGPPDVAR